MSQADIAYAILQTHKLEKLGIVQADPDLDSRVLGTDAKAGRPRVYQSEAEKKKAYRARLRERVTDSATAQNIGSVTI